MTYVALIRGINVGKKSIIMKELAQAVVSAGFKNVRTYIQSGNVIFETNKTSNFVLENKFSKIILNKFGYKVDVMVRTESEMNSLIKTAPFKQIDIKSGKKLYVTFLQRELNPENVKLLKSLNNPQETFILNGSTLYTIRDPQSSFDKTVLGVIDKKIKMAVTTRNWNVVNKIYELMQK